MLCGKNGIAASTAMLGNTCEDDVGAPFDGLFFSKTFVALLNYIVVVSINFVRQREARIGFESTTEKGEFGRGFWLLVKNFDCCHT